MKLGEVNRERGNKFAVFSEEKVVEKDVWWWWWLNYVTWREKDESLVHNEKEIEGE